jgi:hypothetical protein
MKLDPGMHIGLHLVFFGKTSVTPVDLDQVGQGTGSWVQRVGSEAAAPL